MSKQISCAICAAGMEQGGKCPCCGWRDKGIVNSNSGESLFWLLIHMCFLLLILAELNGSFV